MIRRIVRTPALYLIFSLWLLAPVAYPSGLSFEPITPIPEIHRIEKDKIALGDSLFHDPRLSSNNSISCASCHNLAKGGVDNLQHSLGIDGAEGIINAPTVFNSGLNFVQFWDGRALDLNEQVNGPVHNPIEMNSHWAEIVTRLTQDNQLSHRFSALYDDGITPDNIRNAIASFELSLNTLNAPFDRWLKGDEQALTPQQVIGYRLFKSYGCVSCHQGANVGGNMYAHFGAMNNIQRYFKHRGTEITPADLGRFNITGAPEDKHLFKVPSLRLAVKTAPYFHYGSVKTLNEAVKLMARYQLGREIPDEHAKSIISFLHSLVGQHPRLQP